jgi:hypothetical protein
MEGINLTYILSTYINITMYSPVQQLYANNKTIKLKEEDYKSRI